MNNLPLPVETIGLIVFAVFLFFVIIITAARRYKKCPSDKILIVYGKIGKDRSARCIHGGASFIWPLFQQYDFLDLQPMSIEVNLKNALSRQNIRVDVPSRFTVGISTEPGVMEKAAERLLGLNPHTIIELSKDILFGQLRLVIATMDIEEINSDRDKFLENVSKNVEQELKKIGLKLINVNVTDIQDESGYIEALGKEAAAKAINEAKVQVAERTRDGSIGEASAHKEQRIQVALANTEADKGEAGADSDRRIEIARVNAQAVEGENTSKITIAESNSQRDIKETQARNRAEAAKKVAESEAEKQGYEAKKIAELSRAEMVKATQEADIIVAAEIDKKQVEIAAEAEAERERRIARGKADARVQQMQAEAVGLYSILEKKSDGFARLVKASGNNPEVAIRFLIAEQMPDLMKIQASAIEDLKLDNVTVWSGGGSNSSVSGFVGDLFQMLPPLKDILSMKGMGLPEFLQGRKPFPGKPEDSEEQNDPAPEDHDVPVKPPTVANDVPEEAGEPV